MTIGTKFFELAVFLVCGVFVGAERRAFDDGGGFSGQHAECFVRAFEVWVAAGNFAGEAAFLGKWNPGVGDVSGVDCRERGGRVFRGHFSRAADLFGCGVRRAFGYWVC